MGGIDRMAAGASAARAEQQVLGLVTGGISSRLEPVIPEVLDDLALARPVPGERLVVGDVETTTKRRGGGNGFDALAKLTIERRVAIVDFRAGTVARGRAESLDQVLASVQQLASTLRPVPGVEGSSARIDALRGAVDELRRLHHEPGSVLQTRPMPIADAGVPAYERAERAFGRWNEQRSTTRARAAGNLVEVRRQVRGSDQSIAGWKWSSVGPDGGQQIDTPVESWHRPDLEVTLPRQVERSLVYAEDVPRRPAGTQLGFEDVPRREVRAARGERSPWTDPFRSPVISLPLPAAAAYRAVGRLRAALTGLATDASAELPVDFASQGRAAAAHEENRLFLQEIERIRGQATTEPAAPPA